MYFRSLGAPGPGDAEQNTKAPCYLASAAYVALMFNGDAGRALPSDLVLQLDVTYESPRTADAFEPAVA
jgi:hypothetical protein